MLARLSVDANAALARSSGNSNLAVSLLIDLSVTLKRKIAQLVIADLSVRIGFSDLTIAGFYIESSRNQKDPKSARELSKLECLNLRTLQESTDFL